MTTGFGFCSSCGTPRIAAEQRFCAGCGADLSVNVALAPPAAAVELPAVETTPLAAPEPPAPLPASEPIAPPAWSTPFAPEPVAEPPAPPAWSIPPDGAPPAPPAPPAWSVPTDGAQVAPPQWAAPQAASGAPAAPPAPPYPPAYPGAPPPITLAPHPQRLASPSRPSPGSMSRPSCSHRRHRPGRRCGRADLSGYELQVGQHRLLAVDHQLLGGHLGNGDRNAAFIPVLR